MVHLVARSTFGKISNQYSLSSEGTVNDGYGINSRGYIANHGNGYLLVQLVGESRPYTVLKVKKQFSLDGSSESNSKSISDDPQETSEPETKRRRTSNVQSAKAAKDSRKDESGDTKSGKASLKIRKPSDKTSGKKRTRPRGLAYELSKKCRKGADCKARAEQNESEREGFKGAVHQKK